MGRMRAREGVGDREYMKVRRQDIGKDGDRMEESMRVGGGGGG